MYGTIIDITNKESGKSLKIIIRSTICILLITLALTNLTFSVQSNGNSKTAIENFTLFNYKDSQKKVPCWKLTGKRADQSTDELTVYDFTLIINDPDSQSGELLYSISGKQIKLLGSGKDLTAIMPEEIRMKINQKDVQLKGVARDARYHFSTRSIFGSNLQLSKSSEEGEVSLKGSRFTYLHDDEKLVLTDEFMTTISNTEKGQLEISGKELIWFLQKEINMVGQLRASVNSGWVVTSTEMNWNEQKSLLITTGHPTAHKQDLSLQGETISYYEGSEKIVVNEGKLTFED